MAEKQLKYKEYMFRDTTNVEYEMYDCTSNNWSQGSVTKDIKKNLEAIQGKYWIDSLQRTS